MPSMRRATSAPALRGSRGLRPKTTASTSTSELPGIQEGQGRKRGVFKRRFSSKQSAGVRVHKFHCERCWHVHLVTKEKWQYQDVCTCTCHAADDVHEDLDQPSPASTPSRFAGYRTLSSAHIVRKRPHTAAARLHSYSASGRRQSTTSAERRATSIIAPIDRSPPKPNPTVAFGERLASYRLRSLTSPLDSVAVGALHQAGDESGEDVFGDNGDDDAAKAVDPVLLEQAFAEARRTARASVVLKQQQVKAKNDDRVKSVDRLCSQFLTGLRNPPKQQQMAARPKKPTSLKDAAAHGKYDEFWDDAKGMYICNEMMDVSVE